MGKLIKIIQPLVSERRLSSSLINKIYNILYRQIDIHDDNIDLTNSNINGDVYVDGAIYKEYEEYINDVFPNFTIHSDGYYILFKDNTVRDALISAGCGDGTGITLSDAAIFNINSSLKYNEQIEFFPEFSNFTYNNKTNTPSEMFQGCTSLKSIDMSQFTKSISNYMFYNCSSLQTCDVPLTTTIGAYAYANSGITSVNLPSATSLQGNCFKNCKSLTTVNIPNVTSFDGDAFSGCSLLETINIDWSKVISFGPGFLYGCESFGTNMTIDVSTDTSNISYAFAKTQIKRLIVHAHNLAFNDYRYPPFDSMSAVEYIDFSDTNLQSWGDTYSTPKLVTLVVNSGITKLEWRFLYNLPSGFKYAIMLEENPDNITSNEAGGWFRYASSAHVYVKDETVRQRYLANAKFSEVSNLESRVKTLSELPVGVWTTGLYKQYEPYLSHSAEYE